MFKDFFSNILQGFFTTIWWLALIIAFIVLVERIGVYRQKRARKRRDDSDKPEELFTEPLAMDQYKQVDAALEEFTKLVSPDRYCTHTEAVAYKEKYQELYTRIRKTAVLYIDIEHRESCALFVNQYDKIEMHRKGDNGRYKVQELKRQGHYFEKLFANPLSTQQREAIVTHEDNVLVIAGAGSGKTTTIIGKVRYLLEKREVDPEKILLVTYTRNAAVTLQKKIKNRFVHTSTFHSLAMDIIGLHSGSKPTIAPNSTIRQAFYDVKAQKADFIRHLNLFYLYYLKPTLGDFDAENSVEYFRQRKKYGIRCIFNDMDNKAIFTRSEEENMICNFLTQYGVKFRYEEQYEVDTSSSQYGRYYPDFSIYIPTPKGRWKRIYLEHFGVSENNEVPKWFGGGYKGGWSEANRKYNEGMRWKRATHQKFGTKLIHTTSADFRHKVLQKKLFSAFDHYGIPYKERSAAHMHAMISKKDKHWESSIINLIESFIALLKANSKTIDEIKTAIRAEKVTYVRERNLFVLENIIEPVYNAYTQTLHHKRQSDFADCILHATSINNEYHVKKYDYIIVDEFQDTSVDKYQFIQSLRKQGTHLFCVGDDWQSIYRFAGSDIALFQEFEKYFGYTEKCKIETTYRFGEPLIKLSSDFIQKNKNQQKKEIKPVEGNITTYEAIPYTYDEKYEDYRVQMKQVLDAIPEKDSVLILGRYSFDLVRFDGGPFTIDQVEGKLKYGRKSYTFMSVHSAKGLEADHIVLANCDSGIYGFPSKIADDLIINYLLSEADKYEYGEERRLFYVAMTRARKKVHFVYNQDNYSVFMKEVVRKLAKSPNLCPRCQDGQLYVFREGVRKSGAPYRLVKCDNVGGGCDFKRFE